MFACTRKDRLMTRSGSPYLALELRDRTGTVAARVFRDADALAGRFDRGDVRVIRTAVRELRYAFRLFKPYAEKRKVRQAAQAAE